MSFPLLELFNIGGKLIDRLLPDPQANAEAKLKLAELQQNGELQAIGSLSSVDKAQLEVNAVEAQNANLFVSGWRPFIGWVCGFALALYYIPLFVIGMILWIWACIQAGHIVPRPDLGIMEIIGLVSSMLGMATIRMIEKKAGVASK
jgi:hypothetical protein